MKLCANNIIMSDFDDMTEDVPVGAGSFSDAKAKAKHAAEKAKQKAAQAAATAQNVAGQAASAAVEIGEASAAAAVDTATTMTGEKLEQAGQAMQSGETIKSVSGNYYQGAAEYYYGKMAVSGGGGCGCDAPTTGGIEGAADLSDYSEGIYALTKDNLIHDIADAMRGLGLKVEGKSRDELVNSMMKAVPNTRTNRKTFKADARVHK